MDFYAEKHTYNLIEFKTKKRALNFSQRDYCADLLSALSSHPSKTEAYGLSLMYQAKVNLLSAEVEGYEALLRWTHKDVGYINPETCLEIAESFGLSRALQMWVLHKACFDMYQHPFMQCAVNVDPNLLCMDMAREIMGILSDYKISPSRLQLEITEHNAPYSMGSLAAVVSWLRKQGVQIALDDFGTGHATIAYLAKVDLDYVKIDKSLVQGIADSSFMKQELMAIMDLISVSGARIICEGVESHEDALFLKRIGVEQVQGYFFHKPAKLEDLLNFRMSSQQTA